jgi:hypothetical protein
MAKKTNPDYKAIESHCHSHSEISKGLIDEYLMYYASSRFKLDKQFDQEVKRHKFMTSRWNPAVLRYFKAMYINGEIFGRNGCLSDILVDPNLRSLTDDEIELLEIQKEHPWQFSLTAILEKVAPDFYKVVDCFSEEIFLLYSPSTTNILEQDGDKLIYMQRLYNGLCWQSSGIIFAHHVLDEDDFFFFATELNDEIESDLMVSDEMNTNPLPFMLLYEFSEIPQILQGGIISRICYSEEEDVQLDLKKLELDFRISTYKQFVDLKLLTFEGFPHFTRAIYNTNSRQLTLHASSIEGFASLYNKLQECGVPIDPQPMVMISPVMQIAVEKILQRNLDFLEVSDLLDKADEKGKLIEITNHYDNFNNDMDNISTDEDTISEVQLMEFMNLAVPYLNKGLEIPINKLAKDANIPLDTAQGLADILKSKIGR